MFSNQTNYHHIPILPINDLNHIRLQIVFRIYFLFLMIQKFHNLYQVYLQLIRPTYLHLIVGLRFCYRLILLQMNQMRPDIT